MGTRALKRLPDAVGEGWFQVLAFLSHQLSVAMQVRGVDAPIRRSMPPLSALQFDLENVDNTADRFLPLPCFHLSICNTRISHHVQSLVVMALLFCFRAATP